MAHMVMRQRHLTGKYADCPDCQKVIEVERSMEVEFPYCSECNMAVLDATHKYCGWCGVAFDENKS